MAREPRRIERKDWLPETHLGALDSDVDELHRLRLAHEKQTEERIEGVEKKLDTLVSAITKLTLAIIAGLLTLVADILKGTLFS